MSMAKKAAAAVAITAAGATLALAGSTLPASAAPSTAVKPSAVAAKSLSTWGTPNYCTYSVSISVGWAGTHSVTYRSSYWSYNANLGRVMKLHKTYEEYVPITNPGHPGTGSFEHWCDR